VLWYVKQGSGCEMHDTKGIIFEKGVCCYICSATEITFMVSIAIRFPCENVFKRETDSNPNVEWFYFFANCFAQKKTGHFFWFL
jgi:hypothetical protein